MNVLNENPEAIAHFEMAKQKTNHLLHLLLSLITMGWWVFVWVIIGASHTLDNYHLEKRIVGSARLPLVSTCLALLMLSAWGWFIFSFTTVFI